MRLWIQLLPLVLALWAVPLSGAARSHIVYIYADAQGGVHFADRRVHEGYRPYEPPKPEPKALKLPKTTFARALGSPAAWDGVIAWASRAHGLPPSLVKAVVHTESAFNPDAVSPSGAAGLMQLMPDTMRALGVDDPFNPWQNIEGGTRYLGRLVQRFGGDLELALAAYNAGERAVARFEGVPPYPETRQYVKRVLRLYRKYDRSFR